MTIIEVEEEITGNLARLGALKPSSVALLVEGISDSQPLNGWRE